MARPGMLVIICVDQRIAGLIGKHIQGCRGTYWD